MVIVAAERKARCRSAFSQARLAQSQKAETSMSAMGKCVLAPCKFDQMDGSVSTTNYRVLASDESITASECEVST